MRERMVWSRARQDSPAPSAERSDESDCVARSGMHLLWRVSANAFSSPLGSLSPTVANCWYSSTTNSTGRQ